MKKSKKLRPSVRTKKSITNNLFFFSLMLSTIMLVLIEIIYIFFLNFQGFTIETIYPIYIVPILLILTSPLSRLIFKKYFKNFALIESSLSRVADGDFSTRITAKSNGAFEESFKNFNKMASELENNKMLSEEFIHNFSHEFKTPVASIKGFADLILEENVSKEERNQYLDIISKEAERLMHLSETILFISKITSESIMKDKTVYDVGEQIKNCVALLNNQITEKSIEIIASIESIRIYSNNELLQEVWLNILSNAIKFSRRGGRIEINLTYSDKSAVLSVKDFGVGMDENEVGQIFNPYYQADTSHKSAGYGLGLAIVKSIINLANGKITVKSEKDVGSEFIITIPRGY